MSNLMRATTEPSIPLEIEPIDSTNRTPVDQQVVAALTVPGYEPFASNPHFCSLQCTNISDASGQMTR